MHYVIRSIFRHGAGAVICLLALTATEFAMAADRPGVFVFGGTRGVGLEIVKLLDAQDESVSVLVRPTSDLELLGKTGAVTLKGDALEASELAGLLAPGKFRVAISTLGGSLKDGFDVDSVGNINAIDAAKAAGVTRFILISSIGTGDSARVLPPAALNALRDSLAAKGVAEEYLAAQQIDYVIIRPGALTNKPASGRGILAEDSSTSGIISRAELARLVDESLDHPSVSRKTLAAVER